VRESKDKKVEIIMNISFENKVALVTGAASGLGLATAKAFAESGASVVLADWNEKEVQAAAKELADFGSGVNSYAKVLAMRKGRVPRRRSGCRPSNRTSPK